MRRFILLLVLWPAFAFAAPDRAGLIAAWEAAMRSDGTLDAQSDGSYRYRNEAIGYDGKVKIVSAIVRTPRVEAADRGAFGTVDFDLADLPGVRTDAPPTGLAMWKSERQSFVYDASTQAWQTSTEWARSRHYGDGGVRSTLLGWTMEYAIPIGLLALVVAVFGWLVRVQRQAKKQLAASSEVNRLARENIERAAQLQQAQRERLDESLQLARRSAAALEAILEELRRRPSS